METNKEKRFYSALSVVPDVPLHTLDSVERRLRITGTKRKLFLAACLMLAVVIPAVMVHTSNSSSAFANIPESVEEELFHAFEFLNGNDHGLMWDLDNFDRAAKDTAVPEEEPARSRQGSAFATDTRGAD